MRNKGVLAWCRRIVLAVVGLVVLLLLATWLYLRGSLAQLDGERKAPALDAKVTVERDARGVPLISGSSRLDVAYATGYVHAQERFFQMDLLRRVAAGELSELFGSRALEVDRAHRFHRFRARAEQALANASPADMAMLERYVAGVNAGLGDLRAKPFEYLLLGMTPRPWSKADSLLVVWAMYFDLQGSQEARELARGWLREHSSAEQRAFLAPSFSQWDAPLDAVQVPAPQDPIPAAAPDWLLKAAPETKTASAAKAMSPALALAEYQNTIGSNNWAIAGSRTADGAAIVADDMHLGISVPAIWYRVALRYPEGARQRRVVGVSLPGTPLIVAGSNGHVAWGFTNSYGDYLDFIQLGKDAAKPDQVQTPAGWETPVRHEETILVKGAPAEKLVVLETSYGPVRKALGQDYAVHWVAHLATPNLNLGKLETVNTVEQAIATAATVWMPAQNLVAGDDKGNIGWTIIGPLARRAAAGEANTYPLAANDPAAVWDGWLTAEEYPKVINPPGGQLATANSRQLIGAGAEMVGDGGFDLGARTHQVRDDLKALGPRTDVLSVYKVGSDDRAVFLTSWRDRAIKALDSKDLAGQAQRAEMLRLLKDNWTGHASVDSAGYRITRAYMYALYDLLFGNVNAELAKVDPKASMASVTSRWSLVIGRLLDEQPAGWLPPQYASWHALELAAADKVIADLTKDGQPLAAATWGQRNTATSAHPMASAIPVLGKWLKVAPDMLAGDSHMPRVAGPNFGQSERLAVAPGREEQGIFNLPGGQSGHPLSPYFMDERADWVAGKPTPLLPGPVEHTLTFVKP